MNSMKKNFKLVLALVLSVMMILGSVAALAAESYPITITNANATAAHTYTAYQVFSGTLSADGKLANIDWGSGVNGAALLTALKASTAFGATNPFAAATKAEDVADVVATWQDNSAIISAITMKSFRVILTSFPE